MLDAIPTDPVLAEPLVRDADLSEYRAALARHQQGEWDAERFTAFRLRFGVYGQKQPGVQMVRIKIPGGRLSPAWLRTIGQANRTYAQGDAHLTTRQDVQIYSVPLDQSPALLELLYANGITTREACGNTIRNLTACALAGACPRELVDAGKVADQLARAWLRHPLVQNMPRKLKFTVSGCATDCGHSSIHDLGLIAIEKDGQRGFRILAGGGLGSQPRAAVEVLPFVAETDLPAVIEALARLHQRYSDRRNRNASRVKFVVKRFGEEKFRTLFAEEFERVRQLPQRPWTGLEWRDALEAPVSRAPVGLIAAHDGSTAVSVLVPLGILSSDQLDRLAEIAEAAGVTDLRATREQNLVFLGVAADKVAAVVDGVTAIGLQVPASAEQAPTVISCPGTTTCRIGITNSQSFARQALASALNDPLAKGLSVHVSGCQNSCGLHHVADFGLHGAAKKVEGRATPHYQLHFGGDANAGLVGLGGPTIPAKLADQALALLRQALAQGRQSGESVRAWAERLGQDGIAAILAPLDAGATDGLFVDWGDAVDFPGAPQAKGECAAPFAMDLCYADLADDALISTDRHLIAGLHDTARETAADAQAFALRRLLHARGIVTEDGIAVGALLSQVSQVWADSPVIAQAVGQADKAQAQDAQTYREAVAYLLDSVAEAIAAPVPAVAEVGDINALLGAVP
ncbi:nitrite/sulfite reductase [Magnetospirillum gryphiswaldense]|uniref:nitrite/sulfite reductase n=1 Tax=Magnetospirillum gryphiswaldense TaxID=55518 RepID=UPI000D037B00|nr:nitrite/sulfite reductase [Magnetospirillum gryphiswaldense]AVM74237.1 Sulfite reductase [ferredoxin] [Magnetospirillum gryphiswaldense MSR-1]AVM78140.1 Sulfite reductase [ferredoxin] [Magnetospirillum gryphiswaldense]